MALPGSPNTSTDIAVSEHEESPPTSQASPSFSLEQHEAAAALNVKKKAEASQKEKAKRKEARTLTMPQIVSVSALQVSLGDAKKKRDEAKKEAKVETNKVRLARKRVERVKAKAKELSNNDLYEVYLMRMQAEKDKKRRRKKPKKQQKERWESDFQQCDRGDVVHCTLWFSPVDTGAEFPMYIYGAGIAGLVALTCPCLLRSSRVASS